ncbi:hypothetical protein K469DRAFT_130861 [Zopfia rhizophila CBS 207.26]|uniref:Uncharacterized protein n=1 Tax=Zopfia rhizophila CBS 207.26 TaxID=1314779 RepID=A0A6A6EUE4_9PEZI|nr:hypothetical protein K469DRAFT_130861 [Zopfia rhizophila CBS 207.26]
MFFVSVFPRHFSNKKSRMASTFLFFSCSYHGREFPMATCRETQHSLILIMCLDYRSLVSHHCCSETLIPDGLAALTQCYTTKLNSAQLLFLYVYVSHIIESVFEPLTFFLRQQSFPGPESGSRSHIAPSPDNADLRSWWGRCIWFPSLLFRFILAC